MAIVDAGNAGMASGGMGGCFVRHYWRATRAEIDARDAACAGCVAHGTAADRLAAQFGMRGMLATDLFTALWRVVNPDVVDTKDD